MERNSFCLLMSLFVGVTHKKEKTSRKCQRGVAMDDVLEVDRTFVQS